jgi:hypothetical protein
MPTEETTEIEVCVDCASLLANGEVFDSLGEDTTFEHAAKIEREWGTARLVLAGKEGEAPWFADRSCEGCGTTLAGDRMKAVAFT